MCHRRNIRDGMNNETVESIIKNFPCRPIPYCTFKCTIINAKRNSCIYLCCLLFRGKYLKIQKKTEKKIEDRRWYADFVLFFSFLFLTSYWIIRMTGQKSGRYPVGMSPARQRITKKKKGGNTQNVNDENNWTKMWSYDVKSSTTIQQTLFFFFRLSLGQ